jgi:hypothetical protein
VFFFFVRRLCNPFVQCTPLVCASSSTCLNYGLNILFNSNKKETIAPRPVLLTVNPLSGGKENANPNMKLITLLMEHVKKDYRVDLKDNVAQWSLTADSVGPLKQQLDVLSAAYYQALVVREKKALKALKKSTKIADVKVSECITLQHKRKSSTSLIIVN